MKKCIFIIISDAFHITLPTQLEHHSKIITYPNNKQINPLPSFYSLPTKSNQTKPNYISYTPATPAPSFPRMMITTHPQA
jgi:hypothetical protein